MKQNNKSYLVILFIYIHTAINSSFALSLPIGEIGDGTKYADFQFDVKLKPLSQVSIKSVDIVNTVNNSINNYFGINNAKEIFNINIVYGIDANSFLISGILKYKIRKNDFATNNGVLIKSKLKNCNLLKPSTGTADDCSDSSFWAKVNTKKGTLERIVDYPVLSGMEKKSNFAEVTLGIVNNSNIYYGCYAKSQFGKTDLNLDGKDELIVFSGSGGDDFGLSRSSPESSNAKLHISIYSIENIKLPVFSTLMVSNDMNYTEQKGSRKYSKLFFSDFNDDDKLDVFVWMKYFDVFYKTGYREKFVKEVFQLYEEDTLSFIQNKHESQQKLGEIKDKNNLKWLNGFPSKDVCQRSLFEPKITNRVLIQGSKGN